MEEDLASNILEHHGVKGMKWGVRKDGSTSVSTSSSSRFAKKSTDVIARQKPGKFVRTTGGKKQTASNDAVRVAAARQVAKKSTTDSLSNKQIQDAVTRMNLEQQFHSLVKKQNRQTRGQKFIQAIYKSPEAKTAVSTLVKKAAVTAVVA